MSAPIPYNRRRRRVSALEDTVSMTAVESKIPIGEWGNPDITGQDRRMENHQGRDRVQRGQVDRTGQRVIANREFFTDYEAAVAHADAEGAAYTLARLQAAEREKLMASDLARANSLLDGVVDYAAASRAATRRKVRKVG